MLQIVAEDDLELKHIDFDTAFLNGILNEPEDIYMEQPEGQEVGDPKLFVCKLIKSIYGLKQASRVWYKSVSKLLIELGWKPSLVDPCFFTKKSKTGNLMYMSLYVDDSGIAYKKCDEQEWLSDKEEIAKTYKIKDIGDMHWMLHMKITRDRKNKTITISQEAYIRSMIDKFKLTNAVSADNPELVKSLNVESRLLNEEEHSTYRSLVGALLYAAIITRIDIAHAVGDLSRYLASPTEHHLHAARHVLKYLKGTIKLGLLFGDRTKVRSIDDASEVKRRKRIVIKRGEESVKETSPEKSRIRIITLKKKDHNCENIASAGDQKKIYLKNKKDQSCEKADDQHDLETSNHVETYVSTDYDNNKSLLAFTDSDWGGNDRDRRSVTGTIVKYKGSPVSWFSKRQATVALSTTEAEYMAISATVQEALWFRMWMKEVLNEQVKIPVLCDNQGAIKMTKNEGDSQRTKHIDIRHHFIRDHVQKGAIIMKWIATEYQEADILTKRLPTHQFVKLRDKLLVECE